MHNSLALYKQASARFHSFKSEIAGVTGRLALKESVFAPAALEGLSRLERIIGENDLVPVNFLLLALEKSKPVGRIIIRNKLGGIEGYGTGFMISPQLMITNAHVFPNEKIAASSEIEFNYQLDLSGKTSKSVIFSIKPNLLFTTSPEDKLDYTIVSVSAKSTTGKSITPFGYLPVSIQSPVFSVGQAVSIVQHPNGERKQMALRDNNITKIDLPFILYTTDTLGGSSGSPIFNNDWEVGGLHHSGVPELNSKGQVMSVDGKVWMDWMGDQKVKWIANEGINMVDIVADIQKKKWTKKQKTMLKEVIE